MNPKELEADRIYNSVGQRVARFLHLQKARFRAKERARVTWLAQFIPRDGVVVDVGAHFGYFTKEFARLHDGSCSVHAFEPLAYNWAILQRVATRFRNVHLHHRALSDLAGAAELVVPVKRQGKIGPGLAHLGAETERNYLRESVQTVRLDDFVRSTDLRRFDFLKCDVEGAELLVFRGAEQALRQFGPPLYAEVNAAYTSRLGYDPGTLFDFLKNLGYTPHLVGGELNRFTLRPVDGYVGPADYLFRR